MASAPPSLEETKRSPPSTKFLSAFSTGPDGEVDFLKAERVRDLPDVQDPFLVLFWSLGQISSVSSSIS